MRKYREVWISYETQDAYNGGVRKETSPRGIWKLFRECEQRQALMTLKSCYDSHIYKTCKN